MRTTLALLALLALSLPATAEPRAGGRARSSGAPSGSNASAAASVERSNARLRTALDAYLKAQGPARAKARVDARDAVSALLDFDAVAKATLGSHFGELTPAQRTRYSDALRGTMEASYLSRMEQEVGADVAQVKSEVLGEEKQGAHTLVKTQVQSGQDKVQVDYLLQRTHKGEWKAIDIVTEGASLVDTYRDQVSRILPKKGFEGLVGALDKARKKFEAQQEKQSSSL